MEVGVAQRGHRRAEVISGADRKQESSGPQAAGTTVQGRIFRCTLTPEGQSANKLGF